MNSKPICHFDWDLDKAALNRGKHGLEFESVVTVFSDPLALTRYDPEHSEMEERWLTLGQTMSSALVVVAHTFVESGKNQVQIRIISARNATPRERMHYETDPYFVQEERAMQDEYDFSNAERGKFFRRDAVLEIPVYLKPEILAYFIARSKEKGMTLDALLNEVLQNDIERMKAQG